MDLRNNSLDCNIASCSTGTATGTSDPQQLIATANTTDATSATVASITAGGASSSGTNIITSPGPIRKRRFSSAKIQPTRVKKVMQSDDEIGRMVASVPVAIGRAMEHFAEKLLEAAAQCVQCSSSRTLSPSHMKQAVMQTRHFAFLEPLMRDIPLPPTAGSEITWRQDWIEQPPASIQHSFDSNAGNPGNSGVSMPPASVQKTCTAGGVSSVKKRSSNGESDITEMKPKRGRPRKIKKENKCIDDGPSVDSMSLVTSVSANESNGNTLSDRELMPPPALPIRALTTTICLNGTQQQSPVTSQANFAKPSTSSSNDLQYFVSKDSAS